MECLNKNDYDRTKCKDFFEAYKDCKKSWVSVFQTSKYGIGVINSGSFIYQLEKRRQDGLSGKNNKIDV